MQCALFSHRWDEAAGFFHLALLGGESQPLLYKEGGATMKTTSRIKVDALAANSNQTLVWAQATHAQAPGQRSSQGSGEHVGVLGISSGKLKSNP
jgi:hypothetical protein